MLKSGYWHDLTTADFRDLDPEATVTLLPLAAIEQHGPHLPLATDALINQGILAAALPRLPGDLSLLILPTLNVGHSLEHMGFPGTLSVSAEALLALWSEIADGVARTGLRKLILFNSHGGQSALLDLAAVRLRVAHAMLVVRASYFAFGVPDGVFDRNELVSGIHGGEVETSLILHLRPDLVRREALKDFRGLPVQMAGDNRLLGPERPIGFGWMGQDLHPAGVCGNALRADPQRGQQLLEHLAGQLVALVREVAARPLDILRGAPLGLRWYQSPTGNAPSGCNDMDVLRNSHNAIPRETIDRADPLWHAVLAAARLARSTGGQLQAGTYGFGDGGQLQLLSEMDPEALLLWTPNHGWRPAPQCQPAVRDFLDLYLPACRPPSDRCLVIAHLGQSLDGCIATRAGDSCNVTGRANIEHLHRMRALCDAILVGAETVASDDPRLTTRLVEGDNPVRVVLDPHGRLSAWHRLFNDGEAATLVIRAGERCGASKLGQAEVISVPFRRGQLHLPALCDRLYTRGLGSLFIEGGGVTVSAFLRAGLLDRLQVAVSPLLIGDGRRGLCAAPAVSMGDCLRPHCRLFRMGEDVLFDCEPGTRRVPAQMTAAISRIF